MGLDAASFARLAAKRSAALEAMMPATVVIGGTDYTGSTNGSEVENEFEVGGKVVRADKVFEVRMNVLATAPQDGARFQWKVSASDVRDYRVAAVSEQEHSNVWRIYGKRVPVV